LGIRTFKTASPGYLSLIHLLEDGVGRYPNECVAMKKMYVRCSKPTEAKPDNWVITRLTPTDEFRKTLMEANVLLWAISIMTFTYSFIHHFIADSPTSPPFDILEVRFVHGGVTVVHEQMTEPMPVMESTTCRSYLVEEMIDEANDGFYKFINNRNAVPVPFKDESLSSLTEFLSFTQHFQYHKTGGAVYLSDLQGMFLLLQ
ncbi:hypothetical protein B0H13DRAFT_1587330, partial [Mycena leptocephala]